MNFILSEDNQKPAPLIKGKILCAQIPAKTSS